MKNSHKLNVDLIFSAVISALKNLQDKIRKLELERGAAEDNLKSLAIETNKYRDILQRDRDIEEPRQSAVSKNTQGRESDLPLSSNHVTLNLHQENGGISPKSQPSFSQDRDGEVTSLSTRYSLNSHPDVKDDARKMLSQSRGIGRSFVYTHIYSLPAITVTHLTTLYFYFYPHLSALLTFFALW